MNPDIIMTISRMNSVLIIMTIFTKEIMCIVFLLEDSFLHGACVKNEHNLISKLKSTPFFRGKNILNLGYEGNGPLLSLATLREYFPDSKNVKYLFWVYYEGNDLQELNSERMNKILIRYLNNLDYSQNLRIKQEEINNHVTKNSK